MTVERQALSEDDLVRLYSRRIRPDVLDGAARSTAPTAVLVGGQAGSGTALAVAQVRAHMAATTGPTVLLSAEQLRQYHPHWRTEAPHHPHAAAEIRSDVGRWLTMLSADAIASGAHIVYETSMRDPQSTLALAGVLKNAGYAVAAVILAADADQSRQATVARYDVARSIGDLPRFVAASDHDAGYSGAREALGRLENARALDRVQVVTPDGRQLYANELVGGEWARPANATAVLDDFRERRLTARELADSALRWQTLVQRVATDAAVPREVAAQVVAWRNDAVARAEHDPQARELLEWGREAEAFRTMERFKFQRDFPLHAKAVERLDEAIRFAEKNFADAAEREAFVNQARNRLAERIAEGRYSTAARTPPTRDPRSR